MLNHLQTSYKVISIIFLYILIIGADLIYRSFIAPQIIISNLFSDYHQI